MAGELAPMEVASRLERLRTAMGEVGCDALVVTNLVDIRYLTGFSGSAGVCLVGPSETVLVTDGRYRDQATTQIDAAGAAVRVDIAPSSVAQQACLERAAAGAGQIGLQAGHVSWAAQRLYSEWFNPAELVATDGLVEGLREIKDDGEVARLAAASAIADAALAEVRSLLGGAISERAFALELDTAMRRLGSTGVSFETIVASGPNSALPHARPTDRVIREGDLVVVDFGAMVDGYHSDMTRTVMVGEPTPTQGAMFEVVRAAQQAGVDAVAPGAPIAAVDEACRKVIADADWGAAFLHATGHGVGLDIHEAPRVSQQSAATLRPGHVITVEPGVYLPEHGGVRIEDTLLVTDDGWLRLTNAPKDAGLSAAS